MFKTITYSYWRCIKRGTRTFENIPESVKEDVLALAKADVESRAITEADYLRYIGEPYSKADESTE
jgi:hypothetical protein